MNILTSWFDRWSGKIFKAFLLFIVIVLTFPVPIRGLQFGVDASWMAGINWATANRLVYGRDLIFTYGPLGFSLYPIDCGTENWPWIAVGCQLCLYAFWWLSLGLVLVRLEDLEGQVLFAVTSLATVKSDVVTVVIMAVVGYLAVSLSRNSLKLGLLGAFLAGLSIFIKFNTGVCCVATVITWIMLTALLGPPKFAVGKAVATVAMLAATILGVNRAFGGELADLSQYIRNSVEISADYSSQMSVNGPLWPAVYMVAVLAVMVVYAVVGAALGWKSWRMAALVVLPIFFAYKRAITRMDPSHWVPGVVEVAALPVFLMVVNTGTREREMIRWLVGLILFTGVMTAPFGRSPPHLLGLAGAGLFGLVLVWMVGRAIRFRPGERLTYRAPTSVVAVALFTTVAAIALLAGALALPRYGASIKLPLGAKNVLELARVKSGFATPPDTLSRSQLEIPQRMIDAIGQNPIDVYPFRIATILAHPLKYSPRYVFQSYQAYSPLFDEKCADHFRGPGSPKFVLYWHESIDTAHPWIVDTQTWLEIYRWYEIHDEYKCATSAADGMLLLRRRETPRWQGGQRSSESLVELGERLEVPKGRPAHFLLKARLDLTTVGQLVRFLYRVVPPTIRIEYVDGSIDVRRIVWQNTKSGFLVSDLARDAEADRLFFRRGEGDQVRAVTFVADPRYFARQIRVRWEEVPLSVP